MRHYMLVCSDSVAVHRGVAKVMQVADGSFWNGDWRGREFPGRNRECVEAFSIDGSTGEGGLFFNEELASCEGMSFLLFREPEHSDEDLAAAKAKLRHDRDVVRFYVYRITEWYGSPAAVPAGRSA